MTIDGSRGVFPVFVGSDILSQWVQIVLLQSVQHILCRQIAQGVAKRISYQIAGQRMTLYRFNNVEQGVRRGRIVRLIHDVQHHFQQQLFRQRLDLYGWIPFRREPRSDNEVRPAQRDQILIGGFAAQIIKRLAVAVEVVHHDHTVLPHCSQKHEFFMVLLFLLLLKSQARLGGSVLIVGKFQIQNRVPHGLLIVEKSNTHSVFFALPQKGAGGLRFAQSA